MIAVLRNWQEHIENLEVASPCELLEKTAKLSEEMMHCKQEPRTRKWLV